MSKRALIEALNSITIGDLETMSRKVKTIRETAADAGLTEIATILDEALTCLDAADLKTFRKKTHHAVSRLGHLKVGNG